MNLSLSTILERVFLFIKTRYWMLGLYILAFAFVSMLSYLTTYSFLFGYYFGGGVEDTFSNFELFRRIIPFHFNTIAITWLMITLSATLIIYSIKAMKEKKLPSIVAGIFSLVLFHLFLTAFFASEINKTTILSLSGIWFLPIFIASLVIYSLYCSKSSIKTLSGLLLGVTNFILWISLSAIKISEDALVAGFIIIVFTSCAILILLPGKRYLNFLFIFPYVSILVAVTNKFIPYIEISSSSSMLRKILILVVFPIILSISLSILFRRKNNTEKKKMHKFNTQKNVIQAAIDLIKRIMNITGSTPVSVFLIIGLLGAYIGIPRVSTTAAKIIRTFTPESQLHFETITINDVNGNEKNIKGLVIVESDNVIYLSNEFWKLEQIKVDKYFISSDPPNPNCE